ncbi:MAG TPA: hypothetical protein VF741_07785, partial [Candidatus Aquilonibacter sp.]
FIGAAGADTMPPLAQYLMRPQDEINLARSAAPASISNDATILVLGAHGYAVAEKGTNGFTCLVERAWVQPYNTATFWDLTFRAPTCYNAAASQSVLLYTLKRTALALSGATKSQIRQKILAAVAAKTLPIPQPDAIGFMMSKKQNLGGVSWHPHVMFYMPKANMAKSGESWGADRLRSPVFYDAVNDMPEPWAQFFIPVSHWSDGSAAPPYSGT